MSAGPTIYAHAKDCTCEDCGGDPLDKRDERVRQRLLNATRQLREEAYEHELAAKRQFKEARRIEEAVMRQEWWRLGAYLSSQDIESLSNVSPEDLLGDRE